MFLFSFQQLVGICSGPEKEQGASGALTAGVLIVCTALQNLRARKGLREWLSIALLTVCPAMERLVFTPFHPSAPSTMSLTRAGT